MAERMGSDHVSIVLEEQQTNRPLAREHREVILPEVDHDLEQLPLARHRARELRLLQVDERLADVSVDAVEGSRIRLHGVSSTRVAAAKRLPSLAKLPLERGSSGRELTDGVSVEADGRIAGNEAIHRRIGLMIGVELRGDPPVDALLADAGEIARPTAEGQPAESLANLLIGCELATGNGYRNGR